jgi:Flp pilus assembly CpaE family ATPase
MGDTRPILDFSRRLYDNVVIDLGNAYGEWALSAVRASDQVFLVTTNELPALQAAQRVMSYYENHGIARQGIHLIINRFNRDVGLTKEMIETALQTEIYQIVASDYEGVQRALLDGKPIQVSTSIGKQIWKNKRKKRRNPTPAAASPASSASSPAVPDILLFCST